LALANGPLDPSPREAYRRADITKRDEAAPVFDIKWIRDNADAFDVALKRRGLEPLSASLIAID